MTIEDTPMPRRPDPNVSPGTERVRRLRQRQAEAGLPQTERVKRAIATATVGMPHEVRAAILGAMLEQVPADEREGFETVARKLLDLPASEH